jgi:WD40 repeat protein
VRRILLAGIVACFPAIQLASAQDAPRGRELTKGPGPARVTLSTDGKVLAAGSGREVTLWDPASGKRIRALAGHELPIRAVAFTPDGRTLATAAGENRSGKTTGEVKVWDVGTGERKRTLAVEGSDLNALAFSPDGRHLVAGGLRGLWVWDAATGDSKHRVPTTAAVLAVAFTPDGGTLVTGAFDQQVRLWDAKTWAERKVLKGHRSEVRVVAFTPDGKTLATGGVGEIILWNADTGERVRSLKPEATVWSMAFAADGKTLVVGVGDPKDGGDGGVQVWDATTGERTRTWTARGGSVMSVAVASEGKLLATGRYDGTVTVWELGEVGKGK